MQGEQAKRQPTVADQHDVPAFPAHREQRVGQPPVRRGDRQRPDPPRLDRRPAGRTGDPEHVLDVHEPEYPPGVPGHDGKPGQPGTGGEDLQRRRGHVVGDHRHRRPRPHRVGDGTLVQRQRAGDPGVLLRVEQPLGTRLRDQPGQLLRRIDGLHRLGRLDPPDPQHLPGRPLHEDQQRFGGGTEPEHRRTEPDHRLLRSDQGEVLRHHFAEHRVREHHGDQREDEGDRMRGRHRHAYRVEEAGQQVGQRGLGDRSEAQRADRDAELGAGDHQRNLLHRPKRQAGPVGGGGQRFHDGTPGRDQRELPADEERVAQQEQQDDQQGHRSSSGTVTRTCSIRRRCTSTTVNVQPCSSTVSPSTGMCPSRAMMNPASVSYGPSGSRNPVASASSSSRSTPSTSIPGVEVAIGSVTSYAAGSRSYSSVISPTSSSARSSRVTSPSVPPYSSSTMASSASAACNASRTPSRSRLSGTYTGSRAIPATVPVGRRAGGTPSPSIAVTTPVTRSTVDSYTGNRLNPVSRAVASSSATVAVAGSATMSTRGVIASAARLSPNRMVRCNSFAVSSGSAPARAEIAASSPNSSGDRALASSSCGSTPKRRTTMLAVPLSARISQPKSLANILVGPAVRRATGIGRASAAFFGTSSPKSIEIRVAMASASAPSSPSRWPVSGTSSRARAGSARYPVSNAAMVMPSWAAESWKESCRNDLRTVRAARSPAWACVSMAARSTVTSENSAATKNALAAVSSTNAASGNAVIRISMVGSPRDPLCPTRRDRAARRGWPARAERAPTDPARSGQGQHHHRLVVEAVDPADPGDLAVRIEAGERGT